MSFGPEQPRENRDSSSDDGGLVLPSSEIILPSDAGDLKLSPHLLPVDAVLHELTEIFGHLWSRELSTSPESWDVYKPWWGQLDITALSIQDFVGGELKQARLSSAGQGAPYYYLTVGNTNIDPLRETVTHVAEVKEYTDELEAFTTRTLLLSMPRVSERYSRFAARVREAFAA